jgi:hypothetical protein
MRAALLALLLTACQRPAIVVPDVATECRRPATDPAPLKPIRTIEVYRAWAEATARSRDIDKAALIDCQRRLWRAARAIDDIKRQIERD